MDATSGLATSWDARQPLVTSGGIPAYYVVSAAVYSNTLYVGGPLGNIGGQPRGYAAALDVVTANATAFDPKPNMQAIAFAGFGNSLFLGGQFGALGCVGRTNLAAFDLTSRQVTPWNPTAVRPGVNMPVDAMVIAADQVFVGGAFTNVNGTARTNLAAFDLTTGTAATWTPQVSVNYIAALAAWHDRLYLAGSFTDVGGVSRASFAELNLTSRTVTAWNPAFSSASIQAMTVDGDTLYVGGLFSTINAITHRRVAAFDLPTQALTSWDPGITGTASVRAIAVHAGRVHVGGHFSSVAGFYRTNYFSISSDGSILYPAADTDNDVYGLAASDNLVFLAGFFTQVNGQPRRYLAAFDVNSNVLSPWDPNPDFQAEALSVLDNVVYPSGLFLHIGGASQRSIAGYPLSLVGQPSIVSNSVRRLTNGSVSFCVNAVGVPQASVLASTNLSTWQTLQTVPLVGGYGVCTDTEAPALPRRFYRASVP